MTKRGSAPGSAPAPARRAGRRASRPPRRPGTRGTLGAPGLPRISLQSRASRLVLSGVALVLLVGWFVWYATTPEDLPTNEKAISASGVAGTPLYVGMFTPPDDFERTLRISGVKVHATTSADLDITPFLCRRGNVGVTTKPEQFCAEVVDIEGARMVGGDSIILRVETEEAAIAVIDQVSVAFREDVRWDTKPAGNQQAIVTMAARPEVEPTDSATE